MNQLQQAVSFAKLQLSKEYKDNNFIHVKPDILQALVDGLEEQEDSIDYAMRQIQIKSSHINKIEAEIQELKESWDDIQIYKAKCFMLKEALEKVIEITDCDITELFVRKFLMDLYPRKVSV